MPIYEYQCESCCIRFERMQHFKDQPLKECPECGGPVHRLIQPVGIIFKGSGFYITDNRQLSSTSNVPPKALGAPKTEETKSLPAPETKPPPAAETSKSPQKAAAD
ncbi:MAG: zinc ribbon domain-containing protein [Chloroflexi bacterium]|nr:zinc ribbon domain-containing protein [Chloroflexota bacterium]